MAIKEMRSLNFGGPDTYVPVPTDWNQTDETQPDFLKNKPFGEVPVVILEEQDLAFDPEIGMMAPVSVPINDGDNLTVVFDGESYDCDAFFNANVGSTIFGNLILFGGSNNTGEPFAGGYFDGSVFLITADEESHTVGIVANRVNPISNKYLAFPKFYVKPEDCYLYTDVALTTKATIADIPDNSNFEIGIIYTNVVGYWYRPVSVSSRVSAADLGYNVVAVGFNGGSVYYTAEYTPKT